MNNISAMHIMSIIFLLISLQLSAQTSDVRMYIFGHSLINHVTTDSTHTTPSDETTVPHWIGLLSMASENTYSATGQFGFLTSHDDLPPTSHWGFDTVPKSWDADTQSFADADLNTILLTAGNFMQGIKPHDPHYLDTTTSVLHATQDIFDWVHEQGDAPNYYVYINWPEMDLANAYPPTLPTAQEIEDYHIETQGPFLDWWIEYQDSLMVNRPEYDVRFIPVGPIISKILTEVIPGQLPFEETYEDSAPHGFANLYYLAGLITYMATFETPTPDHFDPGTIIHASLKSNYTLIRDFIWSELQAFNFENGDSRVFTNDMTTYVDNITLDESSLTLSPNPNDGSFLITGLINDYEINIIHQNGTIHQSIENTGSDSLSIDLQNLPVGIYYVHILDIATQKTLLERVIKR